MSRKAALPWTALAGGFALLLGGLVRETVLATVAWEPTAFLAALALIALFASVAVKFLRRCTWATGIAVVWLVALLYFAGLLPALSVGLICASSLALGSMFVPEGWPARPTLSILAGLAVICGLDGWLLPFPIHGRLVYIAVLMLMIYLRRHALKSLLAPLPRQWSAAVSGSPLAAALVVLVVGVVSTCAWVPTIAYDDMTYHLGLPSQLHDLGVYRLDISSRVWAASAWAGDVLHAVTWVVSGTQGRGTLDIFWLLATCVLIWQMAATLGLRPLLCWAAVALYASLPVSAGTLGAMQTEGPARRWW